MSYLKKYEYVIAVADCGGISQAAEKLGISQPTFSKYLKKIELELGMELFDRSTLPIRLTRAGECYVSAGKRFIDLDRQLVKQLEEVKLNQNSVIRVGISPSRSPYMMPDIICKYKKRCPNGRIVIEERTTKELNERLESGELDLIISLLDKDTQGFERAHLFDEHIMLAAPKAQAQGLSVKEILMSMPLISVGRGQAMWQTLNDITQDMGIPSPEIECQSIESALALVKRGIGATIVPSYIATEENDKVCFMPLDDEAEKRSVCVFYRKEQFLTQSEKIFIECVTNKNKEGK